MEILCKNMKNPDLKTTRKSFRSISVIAFIMIIVSAVCAGLVIGLHEGGAAPVGTAIRHKPTQAISKTCSRTRFPDLCVNSLLKFPDPFTANEQDLVLVCFKMTLLHFSDSFYTTTSVSNIQMDPHVQLAFDDCLELLEDSLDALSRSLSAVIPSRNGNNNGGSTQDVITLLKLFN